MTLGPKPFHRRIAAEILKESQSSEFHLLRTDMEFLEADLTSDGITPDFSDISA